MPWCKKLLYFRTLHPVKVTWKVRILRHVPIQKRNISLMIYWSPWQNELYGQYINFTKILHIKSAILKEQINTICKSFFSSYSALYAQSRILRYWKLQWYHLWCILKTLRSLTSKVRFYYHFKSLFSICMQFNSLLFKTFLWS